MAVGDGLYLVLELLTYGTCMYVPHHQPPPVTSKKGEHGYISNNYCESDDVEIPVVWKEEQRY